jgi:hypothetical protein
VLGGVPLELRTLDAEPAPRPAGHKAGALFVFHLPQISTHIHIHIQTNICTQMSLVNE